MCAIFGYHLNQVSKRTSGGAKADVLIQIQTHPQRRQRFIEISSILHPHPRHFGPNLHLVFVARKFLTESSECSQFLVCVVFQFVVDYIEVQLQSLFICNRVLEGLIQKLSCFFVCCKSFPSVGSRVI